MQLLIIGFDEDDTRELSRHLRAAGHAVLGAQGRHGARTFIHAVTPDAIVVPEGPRGAVAAGWLEDLGLTVPFVAASVDAAAPTLIRRVVDGSDDAVSSVDEDDVYGSTGGVAAAIDVVPPIPVEVPPPTDATVTADASTAEAEVDVSIDESESDADARDAWDASEDDAWDDEEDDDAFVDDDIVAPSVIEVIAPGSPAATDGHAHADARGPRGASETGVWSGADSVTSETTQPPRAIHPDLASKLAHVRLSDYFSIVEVEPNASTWNIREACDRLGRRFSARGWPHRLHPEELEALDEISRGLADALLVLGDEDLRMRYQRALAAAAQGLNPSDAAR